MADILQFVPKRKRTAVENLAEFIRMSREDLTVFGTNLDWEKDYWQAAGVSFGNLDQTGSKLDPANTLKQPFLLFAKAYFRYQRGHKPTGSKLEIQALRCIERALTQSRVVADVSCVDGSILDQAAVQAREHYKPGTAYHVGRELARLALFLSEKQVIPRVLDWKSPIKRPTDTVRTGPKAREQREKKLPSTEVLNALADIFAQHPRESRDIFTTCTVAMLLCAPSRISEILSLKEDCEVWEMKRDGIQAYGWRFQPGKGGSPMIKWIPDCMVSLAQEAIGRVREMTIEGRRIASWLENNPREFYRHASCPEVPEDAPLTTLQSALALGIPVEKVFYFQSELRRKKLSSMDGENTLRTLNYWVRSGLPEDFPWFDQERGIRFSEALFCLQDKQLRTDMPSSVFMIWRPDNNVLNSDLGPCETKTGYFPPSIFDRWQIAPGEHNCLKVTSHQFRHLLNTMAQRGGLAQSEIARWSGRTDAKQNRVYDHMSEFELADMLRVQDPGLTLDRPLTEIAQQIARQIPMTQQEFNAMTIPTAHVTEYGFCIHDFVMSPCQRFRDCLNCTEQICVKGDRRLDRIRIRFKQVQELKQRAEVAIAAGFAGADRWYEIQALTEMRLASLVTILENPEIEDGAIIRLNNKNEFSPWRRAMEAKAIALRSINQQLQLSVSVNIPGKSDG